MTHTVQRISPDDCRTTLADAYEVDPQTFANHCYEDGLEIVSNVAIANRHWIVYLVGGAGRLTGYRTTFNLRRYTP